LLQRLRGGTDRPAWERFDQLYRPFIHGWLLRQSTPRQDVDDLAQEVMSLIFQELPNFQHNGRAGAFRTWVRLITTNRLRTYWHGGRGRPVATGDTQFLQALQELEDPHSTLTRRWEKEHDAHIVARLLELMAQEFEPATLQAFRRLTFENAAPQAVADELGMSLGAVYIAKSRVLRRLREEAREVLD
jgi:RNA polymerase sigma-70 factor (ECF subfamily)